MAPGFLPRQSGPLTFNTRYELFPARGLLLGLPGRSAGTGRTLPHRLSPATPHRLFGLKSLTRLRILQVNLTDDYPLSVLAENPALKNLTHLSFHPLPNRGGNQAYLTGEHLADLARATNLPALTHLRFQRSSAGDDGVRALLDSGMLARLELLDLAMGTITDAGADLLVNANLPRLRVLDLSHNAISNAGVQRLRCGSSWTRDSNCAWPNRSTLPARSGCTKARWSDLHAALRQQQEALPWVSIRHTEVSSAGRATHRPRKEL